MTLIEYIEQRGIDDKPTLQTIKIDYFKSLKGVANEEYRQYLITTTLYDEMLEYLKEIYVIDGCKCAIGSMRLIDVRR